MLLEALALNLGAGSQAVTPGAVAQALNALALHLRAHDLSTSYVTLVMLETLALNLGAGPQTAAPGGVTQALETLALNLQAGLVGTPPRILVLLGSPETGYIGVVWLDAPDVGLLGRRFPSGGMTG